MDIYQKKRGERERRENAGWVGGVFRLVYTSGRDPSNCEVDQWGDRELAPVFILNGSERFITCLKEPKTYVTHTFAVNDCWNDFLKNFTSQCVILAPYL